MTRLNCLSDNQLRLSLFTIDGTPIESNTMWVKVYLRAGGKTFYCINDPEGVHNKHCHVDGDVLIVDIPGRSLRPGILEYMIEVREVCHFFADRYKNTFSIKYKPLEIEMV